MRQAGGNSRLRLRRHGRGGLDGNGDGVRLVAIDGMAMVVRPDRRYRAEQPNDRGLVREMPTTSMRRLTSLLSRSSGLLTGMRVEVPAHPAGRRVLAYRATIRDEGHREHVSGRPIHLMSRELALVPGRPFDLPVALRARIRSVVLPTAPVRDACKGAS